MKLRHCTGTALGAILVALAMGPVLAEETASTPGSDAASAAAPAASQSSATLPASDEGFVAKIRAAIVNHDLAYFEAHLIDWEGVRKRTQRLTLYQIRQCFGRPIKSIGLEPLKSDPATPLVPAGYHTNLPVTHLLRIAFDEQHGTDETPACVFMLSKDPKGSYRMALVLSSAPPPK